MVEYLKAEQIPSYLLSDTLLKLNHVEAIIKKWEADKIKAETKKAKDKKWNR